MRRLASLAVLAVFAAGCGGADKQEAPRAQRTPAASATATGADAKRREPIIRGWSEALRRSDVEAASKFFALPVIVSQGKAVRLRSRARIRTFNQALPCGARLLSVRTDGRYVVGTFRLVERPGQTCDGPGNLARVAFVFEGDRISEWRQVLAAPGAPPGPSAPEPNVPDAPEAPSDAQAA